MTNKVSPDTEINNDEMISRSPKVVSYSLLVIIILSFLLGALVLLLIQNIVGKEEFYFSTIELINFTISIFVSGASIILAISAIVLGKISEKTIIDRNEASVKLQNQIYLQTSQALTKIQSSTGVTERRLEDLIAGRAKQVALQEFPDPKDKERRTRLIEAFKGKPISDDLEDYNQLLKFSEERKGYKFFMIDIQNKLSKTDNIKTIKTGSGDFSGTKEKLVDGVFIFHDKTKFSVSTLSSSLGLSKNSFDKYILDLATEIKNKTFDVSFLAFQEKFDRTNKFLIYFEDLKNLINRRIIGKIVIFSGDSQAIIDDIVSYLSKK